MVERSQRGKTGLVSDFNDAGVALFQQLNGIVEPQTVDVAGEADAQGSAE